MYALVLITLSIVSTLVWYRKRGGKIKFRFDTFALITGGSGLMFLIDNLFNYSEEGVLFKLDTETFVLTIVLAFSAIVLCLLITLISSLRLLKRNNY